MFGIKLLKGATQEIMGKITSQINVMQDLQDELTSSASILGEAWVGEDADAFVDELQTRVIPEIADLIAALSGLPGGIGNAMDIIDGADSASSSMWSNARSIFSSIF